MPPKSKKCKVFSKITTWHIFLLRYYFICWRCLHINLYLAGGQERLAVYSHEGVFLFKDVIFHVDSWLSITRQFMCYISVKYHGNHRQWIRQTNMSFFPLCSLIWHDLFSSLVLGLISKTFISCTSVLSFKVFSIIQLFQLSHKLERLEEIWYLTFSFCNFFFFSYKDNNVLATCCGCICRLGLGLCFMDEEAGSFLDDKRIMHQPKSSPHDL